MVLEDQEIDRKVCKGSGNDPTVKEVYTVVLSKGLIEPASRRLIQSWTFLVAKIDALSRNW